MSKPPATYQVDGAAIRTRRKALGLSQAECARRAGITRAYLSQLETGARQDMRPPTYARLRSALKSKRSDRLLLRTQQGQPGEEPDDCHEGTTGSEQDG
jgi:transcriptional regulator with XRE-family HTH domain